MDIFPADADAVFRFEFHDSEVRQARYDGGVLTIVFSAAFVRRPDGAFGYVQGLQMQLPQADIALATPALLATAIGRLSGGRLQLAGTMQARTTQAHITLPCELPGPLQLELQFSNGSTLQTNASALVCSFHGDPQFRESLAC